MSGTFRIHNNTASYSAEVAKENVHPKLSRAGNSKRPALGNVTNQLRRQPQRVAKGKVKMCKLKFEAFQQRKLGKIAQQILIGFLTWQE